MKYGFSLKVGLAALAITAVAGSALATHSWGGYHWARTANPFTLKLGDNVSSAWDATLSTASGDWSLSNVLDTAIVPTATNKNCRAVSGRVEVCNRTYGNNGWLGVAQIWITGGTHITQGTVKMNDTYFNTSTYNTPAWRNLVMCQEIGHTLGLDHQDENFNNPPLGTCMDYTPDPTPNQHPNAHDYAELELIYSHLDSFATSSALSAGTRNQENDEELGKPVKHGARGRTSVFERDLDRGEKVFTFVFWAE